eukprot:GHVN01004508.1.p1 GENE.GHVN01004508.1~~GHVN01004508.1.p1  ORF type:complete len:957 (+),score=82.20 GHVN01004508.1:176-3046(+)
MDWIIKDATRAVREKRYCDSIERCKDGLRLDPENTKLNTLLGIAYFQTGEYEKCEVAYTKALSMDSKDALSLRGLVELYQKTTKLPEMLAACTRLVPLLEEEQRTKVVSKILEIESDMLAKIRSIDALSVFYCETASFLKQKGDVIRKIIDAIEICEGAMIKNEIKTQRHKIELGKHKEFEQSVNKKYKEQTRLLYFYNEILAYCSPEDEKAFLLKKIELLSFKDTLGEEAGEFILLCQKMKHYSEIAANTLLDIFDFDISSPKNAISQFRGLIIDTQQKNISIALELSCLFQQLSFPAFPKITGIASSLEKEPIFSSLLAIYILNAQKETSEELRVLLEKTQARVSAVEIKHCVSLKASTELEHFKALFLYRRRAFEEVCFLHSTDTRILFLKQKASFHFSKQASVNFGKHFLLSPAKETENTLDSKTIQAHALYALRKYKEAADIAAEIYPANKTVLDHLLRLISLQMENGSTAIIPEDTGDVTFQNSNYISGLLSFQKKKYQQAEKAFWKALSPAKPKREIESLLQEAFYETREHVSAYLIQTLLHLKKHQKAYALFEKEPPRKDLTGLRTAACLFHFVGKPSDCIEHLRVLLRKAPNPFFCFLMGEKLLQVGSMQAAHRSFLREKTFYTEETKNSLRCDIYIAKTSPNLKKAKALSAFVFQVTQERHSEIFPLSAKEHLQILIQNTGKQKTVDCLMETISAYKKTTEVISGTGGMEDFLICVASDILRLSLPILHLMENNRLFQSLETIYEALGYIGTPLKWIGAAEALAAFSVSYLAERHPKKALLCFQTLLIFDECRQAPAIIDPIKLHVFSICEKTLRHDPAWLLCGKTLSFLSISEPSFKNHALHCLITAVELTPEEAWVDLGFHYLFGGEIEKACRCFQTSLSFREDSAKPWLGLSLLKLQRERRPNYIQAMLLAEDKAPLLFSKYVYSPEDSEQVASKIISEYASL